MKVKSATCWALKWYSKNRVDGEQEHIIYEGRLPALFRTRREALDFRENRCYGYFRTRKDLLNEPHGWRVPTCIRVKVIEV